MGQKGSIVGSRSRPQSFKKIDQKRKEEDEKSPKDLKAATNNVNLEVEKEVKQLTDSNFKREQDHQQHTNGLQEQAKETSSFGNDLRSHVEDARQKMCLFDNRVSEVETQVLEELKASSAIRKRVEELEEEIRRVRKQVETEIDVQRVRKEMEDEKEAREEAEAKIAALEQQMSAAMKELDLERRRLKVATDKITLVEMHLRDFESTAEEMKGLFEKQRDELNEMQTSLMEVEDGNRDHED